MSRINKIIELVETKKHSYIVCSRCKGSGIVDSHVYCGMCFKCDGKGEIPNKWLQIYIDVTELQCDIASFSQIIKRYENETNKKYKLNLYLQYVQHRDSKKEDFKNRILKLEKRVGL